MKKTTNVPTTAPKTATINHHTTTATGKPKIGIRLAGSGAVSEFGHRLSSMAGRIDTLLLQKGGVSGAELLKQLTADFSRTERLAVSKVNSHFTYLVRQNMATVKQFENGNFYAVPIADNDN